MNNYIKSRKDVYSTMLLSLILFIILASTLIGINHLIELNSEFIKLKYLYYTKYLLWFILIIISLSTIKDLILLYKNYNLNKSILTTRVILIGIQVVTLHKIISSLRTVSSTYIFNNRQILFKSLEEITANYTATLIIAFIIILACAIKLNIEFKKLKKQEEHEYAKDKL